jgi:general secretion pathway protein D
MPSRFPAHLLATLTVAAVTVARGQATQPTIALNFPGPVPVQTLVDYVSARLGVNIVYDEEQLRKAGSVVVRAPEPVSPGELAGLLSNVLATKRLALVRDERTGLLRVADVATLPAVPPPPRVERVQLAYADAARLAPQVKELVVAAGGPDAPANRIDVSFDGRTNQLILVGSPAAVDEALAIARLVDIPAATEQGSLQFYKLTNATAADVLDTIRDLEGRPPSARPRPTSPAPNNDLSPAGAGGPSTTGGGANAGQPGVGSAGQPGSGFGQVAPGTGGNGRLNVGSFADATAAAADAGPTDVQPSGNAGGNGSRLGGEAVTADPNTNTIIVRGGPEVQKTYRQLIETLDKRRPQVLLEATVVDIDTTHNFSFGVELSAHSNGATKFLSFSQFGLSTVNVATGALTPNASQGGTAAVIGTGVANAVINALVTDGHARVESAPRVLVNDNATGLLASIAEQPYSSVNASTTVATTSFGGYADAGTTITLTPHISEGDYLQLEYAVELSSFTGTADAATGEPPPRQTDRVESKVTIPDGSTIIVGGLNRRTLNRDVSAVPILGQIPFLRFLFSSRSTTASTETLFVFLRPTILRDESFVDLRNLSEGDLRDAGIPTNFPRSGPVVMR